MKKKYIIITGVAGMIGSELLDQIIKKIILFMAWIMFLKNLLKFEKKNFKF